jgi:hypothetical protein
VKDAVSKRPVMQAKRMAPLPDYIAPCATFKRFELNGQLPPELRQHRSRQDTLHDVQGGALPSCSCTLAGIRGKKGGNGGVGAPDDQTSVRLLRPADRNSSMRSAAQPKEMQPRAGAARSPPAQQR